MAKRVVGVDLDEVLGGFIPALCLWHNDKYGTDLDVNSFHSYKFCEVNRSMLPGVFEVVSGTRPVSSFVAWRVRRVLTSLHECNHKAHQRVGVEPSPLAAGVGRHQRRIDRKGSRVLRDAFFH